MKVALTFDIQPLQRMQIAGFLGRPGELATRNEVIAFLALAIQRRFDELPKPSASMSSTLTVMGAILE